MIKKYKLTNEIITIDGHELYRIESLQDFGHVKKGDLGGYIEEEDNLSHTGRCWVSDNARVFGAAHIYEYAQVSENAQISGESRIYSNAHVSGNARIHGRTLVFGYSKIFENAIIRGNVYITHESVISGNTIINLICDIYALEVSADHGYWEKIFEENNKLYLISNTLEKLKVTGY